MILDLGSRRLNRFLEELWITFERCFEVVTLFLFRGNQVTNKIETPTTSPVRDHGGSLVKEVQREIPSFTLSG